MTRYRKRLSAALGLGLVASGVLLVPAPAQAASAGLVISEFYGNGGNLGATLNADFIELYNPTSQEIPLSGLSVQYRSTAGTGAANGVAPLSGKVAAGEHFLVRLTNPSATNGSALPTPDLVTSGVSAGGTNGTIWLASTQAGINPGTGSVVTHAQVIDLIGFGSSNTFETAAATGVTDNTKSFHRKDVSTDGDNNASEFEAAAPTPDACGAVCAAPLDAPAQADKTGYIGVQMPGFTLTATGGFGAYTWNVSGLPDGLSASPSGAISGTPTTQGTSTVTATVTDELSQTDQVTFTITVEAEPQSKTIAEIQGTGARSPLAPAEGTGAGVTVLTTGVVTGMYADPYPATLGTSGGFDGMYIQTPGADTEGSSDAIFVYGSNAMPAGVAVGDSVKVIGPVSEFGGLTQITPGSGGVTELSPSLGTAVARQIAYPASDAGREAHEGELVDLTDTLTVSNTYSANQYGELGLATGDTPLRQPTEFVRDDDTAGLAEIKADNAARAIALDDGTSINFLNYGNPEQDLPVPWLTKTHAVRVGAEVNPLVPMLLDYRNSTWKLQPPRPVKDAGTAVVDFEDTRPANLQPQAVGGDLTIATFNVLNYFNTTGEQYVANGAAQNPAVNTQCTWYTDRDDNRIANNRCGIVTNGNNAGNGPRGAATQVSFERQQAKIVTAINTLGADIVGLEEIENSMKLVGETNRDDALAALVKALNAAAGPGTWKYVHSPAEALVSTAVSEQDTIRPAFIYRAAKVTPVGQSDILFGTTEFANAREPLAQAFKPKGALDSEAFAVIVNHFKSKGDSDPVATGDNANSPDVGAFNGDRVRQATKLAEFAEDFAEARDLEAVFLAGDFNSYTHEDPMHVLYDAGYEAIESTTDPGEESYSYGGLSGSLDHVLGNAAATAMVTGADIWDINAAESVAYQYSRWNYNVTELFDATNPFAASDHNPEIVGIDVGDYGTDYTPVQVLATNDFHGRLLADGTNAAGAAVLSGAVKELREEYPNTVFAAAGDLIGASTFESFIQHDEPTIDALNEAGLEVSAAGNHEFDAGYEDLVGRVQSRAEWEYIAANIEEPEGRDDLAETWSQTFQVGEHEVEIGFVGAVTEDLESLVAPAGIEGVNVTDIVDATNEAAADLRESGADLVILLVHEGSPTTACSSMTNPDTAWGGIVTGVSADVDAIVSGHTHLAYNCSFPVQEWATEGRSVTDRPVVSAGQYGTFLNQLVFTYDNATGELVASSQEVIGLAGTGYAPDPAVTAIVDAAKAQADTLGAQVLGRIGGAFNRAKLANGTTENRGGESTLGNLVAEVQRWATSTPEAGSAQIAFMNPGGLRADMTGTGSYPSTLTYKQAAVVQPFANTLVNMDLTGANIKLALEQQWQRDTSGAIPSRPFLRLGISKGLTYTYDPSRPEGDRITGMWLNGQPISTTSTYSVTVNSFLASGGDNFRAFNNGTDKRDTGKVDLQAMVDYLESFASGETPLPVDRTQRSVGVTFATGSPAAYYPGEHVRFSLSSLAFSTAADTKDATVEVFVGETSLGTFAVDNSIGTDVTDEYGKAPVDVTLPSGLAAGQQTLRVVGTTTGTVAKVPVRVLGRTTDPGPVTTTTTAVASPLVYGTGGSVTVTVTPATAAGAVTLTEGAVTIGVGTVSAGTATVAVAPNALPPGSHTLTVAYSGDAGHLPSTGTAVVTVEKASSQLAAAVEPDEIETGETATVTATVDAEGVTPTGTVEAVVGGSVVGSAQLSGGQATIQVGPFATAGTRTIEVRYTGDAQVAASTDSVDLVVVTPEPDPIQPQVKVGHHPGKVKAGKTRATLVVRVKAGGVTPTGTVEVKVPGHGVLTASLVDGRAELRLPVFAKPGTKELTVTYSGDESVEAAEVGHDLVVKAGKKG